MAASSSNDNQGLKIAVACFVMLSVILAVTTYFGFANASVAEKKLEAALGEKKGADDELAKNIRTLTDVKEKIGLAKTSDEDLPKAITKSVEDVQKKANTIAEETRKIIDGYKGAGGALGKMDEVKQSNDTITQGFATPTMSMNASLERLVELLNNQATLATLLGLEFHDTRKQLEAMNGVNDSKLQVEVAAVKKTKEDLEAEHTDHETRRNVLILKVDALQSELNKSEQKVQKLTNDLAQLQDESRKNREDLLVQLRNWRDQAQRQETILDKKDGVITFVDHTLNEIRTDINRRMGAREQMILSVFDRNAAGIPSDKVKGTIQLIRVTDTGSIGKILTMKTPSDPIRQYDQLYSAAWSPNRPQQFALIGKMDINRDGRDDRADLKRMIEAAGGVVAYDLPPPGVGQETGKITPYIRWYVEDTRDTFHPQQDRDRNAVMGDGEKKFLDVKTKAIQVAREDGIIPITIERLLDQLGYSYSASVPGRAEASDRRAIENLLYPRGKVVTPAAETPPAETPPADKPPAAESPK